MNIGKQKLTCEEANQHDLVDYLASLGYQPEKIRGYNYWYLSMLPDRFEKNASFKVNRNKNQWYDFGNGAGGSLIDFGIRYHNCSVADLLELHSGSVTIGQIVSRAPYSMGKEPEQKLVILEEKPIQSDRLILYLRNRRIPLDVAREYLQEIKYQVKEKPYYALGFKNDVGGYELRNEYFKSSSSPKTVRFIDRGVDQITVFEGFFDFLSFLSIHKNQDTPLSNFLVLNSLAFFEKARPVMERHRQINLYLDRDRSGIQTTRYALQYSNKYQDHSDLYKGYKDLNGWICRIGSAPVQRLSSGAVKKSQHL